MIAFFSDFGLKDQYVAQVKSVIYGICPQTEVIDLTHMIEPFCVECGAYVVDTSINWFPEDTVFLGVIDPGVGGKRKPIILRGMSRWFVGPDNGLFSTVIKNEDTRAWVIDPSLLPIRYVSHTFHGRDIFAPAAALLSCGKDPSEFAEEIDTSELITIDLLWKHIEGPTRCMKVIYIDRFGNIALSEKGGLEAPLGSELLLEVGGSRYKAYYVKTFSQVDEGGVAVYVNSFGYLEVAVNKGDASYILGLKVGDKLCLTPVKSVAVREG